MKFSHVLFLIAINCIVWTQCSKSDNAEAYKGTRVDKGRIIGFDYRKCATPFCSGWFVEIGQDTFRFFEEAQFKDYDLHHDHQNFPLQVTIEWSRYTNEWKDVSDLIYVHDLTGR